MNSFLRVLKSASYTAVENAVREATSNDRSQSFDDFKKVENK
jgi:hypothetical protein